MRARDDHDPSHPESLVKNGRLMVRNCLFLAIMVWLLMVVDLPVHAESLASEREGPWPAAVHDKTTSAFKDCSFCPEMVSLPGGTFLMGSPDEEIGRYANEGPQRQVSLPPFALGRYEVTRGEFAQFVKETGHTGGPCVYWDVGFGDIRRGYDLDLHNPSHQHRQTDQHPVTCVSWGDAQAYLGWLRGKTGRDYRLPSEAEWEYAARAGTRSRYFWGDNTSSACGHANGHDEMGRESNAFNWRALPCSDGFGLTAPVGSLMANGFSLFDMAGNLWEWVEDHYHETYEGAPVDGSAWLSPGRSVRALRGGSWENQPRDLRSASRIWSRPASRLNSSGFRVALTLSTVSE